MHKTSTLTLLALAGAFVHCATFAAESQPAPQSGLRFANIFNDDMVLQQQKPLKVSGWAKPGASVTVIITEDERAAVAHAGEKAFDRTRYGKDGRPITARPMTLRRKSEKDSRGTPTIGERIEPWGSPTADAYVEKIRGNLDTLDAMPEVRLNYQFSGVEIESLVSRFPDVYERLGAKLAENTLDFDRKREAA